jgi:nucleoside-diphosphate-sugar epimerase
VPFEAVYGSYFQDIPRRVPDISKIKRYIDYDPQTELTQIISELAADIGNRNSMKIQSSSS